MNRRQADKLAARIGQSPGHRVIIQTHLGRGRYSLLCKGPDVNGVEGSYAVDEPAQWDARLERLAVEKAEKAERAAIEAAGSPAPQRQVDPDRVRLMVGHPHLSS